MTWIDPEMVGPWNFFPPWGKPLLPGEIKCQVCQTQFKYSHKPHPSQGWVQFYKHTPQHTVVLFKTQFYQKK